jgi:F0F1-type ATP synthase membrane subunit a
MHEISLAAEKIFELYGQPITNSLIATFLTSLFIILLVLIYRSNVRKIPTKLQSIIELPVEALYNLAEGVTPHHARELFPLISTRVTQ